MKEILKSMLVLSLLVFFCAYGVQSIAANERQLKQSEYAYYTQLSGDPVKDNITIQKYPRPMYTQWKLAPDAGVFDNNGKAIFVLAPMSESATPAPEVMPLPTLTPVMGATPTPGDEMFESGDGSGDDYDFTDDFTTPTPQTFRYFGMATPSPQANMQQFEGTFPTPAPTPAPDAGYSLSQFTTAMPDFGYSSPLPLQMASPRPTPTMSRAQERRRLIMPTVTPRPRRTTRPAPKVTATPGENEPLSRLIRLATPVPETPSQPENEQLLFENPTTPSPGGAPYIYGLPTMSPSPGFLFSNGGNGHGNGNGNGNGNMMDLSPGFWQPTMTPMVRPTVTPMSLY